MESTPTLSSLVYQVYEQDYSFCCPGFHSRTGIPHSLRLRTRYTDWNYSFPTSSWVSIAAWNSAFPSLKYQVHGLEFSIPYVILGLTADWNSTFPAPYYQVYGLELFIPCVVLGLEIRFAVWNSSFPVLTNQVHGLEFTSLRLPGRCESI